MVICDRLVPIYNKNEQNIEKLLQIDLEQPETEAAIRQQTKERIFITSIKITADRNGYKKETKETGSFWNSKNEKHQIADQTTS